MSAGDDALVQAEAQEWIEAITQRSFGGAGFAAGLKDGVLLCMLVNSIRPDTIKKYCLSPKMAIQRQENVTQFLKAVRGWGMKEFVRLPRAIKPRAQRRASRSNSQPQAPQPYPNRSCSARWSKSAPHPRSQPTQAALTLSCHNRKTPHAIPNSLTDEKNLRVVGQCIHALGRLLQSPPFAELGLPKLGKRVVEKQVREFTEEQLREATSAVSVTPRVSVAAFPPASVAVMVSVWAPMSRSPRFSAAS